MKTSINSDAYIFAIIHHDQQLEDIRTCLTASNIPNNYNKYEKNAFIKATMPFTFINNVLLKKCIDHKIMLKVG